MNMEISDCENEDEGHENWSCPEEDNQNSKKIKSSNLLSSIFQSPYSDSEDDTNVTLSPENHSRNNKNKDIDMINMSSDDEQDIQSAIMYSLRTLAQEKDRKQKSVVPACKLTPMTFSTLGGTHEMGSTSLPRTCCLCRDLVFYPNMPIVTPPCHHLFCNGCLSRYVGEKVKENIVQVACPVPKCCTVFYASFIWEMLPIEVKDRWSLAMYERSVLSYTWRFICPLEGCGRICVNDQRNYQIRACTCCWRLFCVKCGAGWHMGMTCQQFEKREEEAKRRRRIINARREEERRLKEEEEIERRLKQWLKEAEGEVINSGFGSTLLPILNKFSFIIQHKD